MTQSHETTYKTEQFAALLSKFASPTTVRGRKPSPLIIGNCSGTQFPAIHAAYVLRLHHFKLLTAVDRNLPCQDPIAETKACVGSVRRTLWLYLHRCLPDFSGKAQGLADLMATHDANLLMKGIEQIVIKLLLDGTVSDSTLAEALLDDLSLMEFAAQWFSRVKRSRANQSQPVLI